MMLILSLRLDAAEARDGSRCRSPMAIQSAEKLIAGQGSVELALKFG